MDLFTSLPASTDPADEQAALPIVWKEVSVLCETSWRRRVGEVSMLLADVGWEHLALFRRATPSRATTAPPLLAILHQQTAVRPIPASAIEAADGWITEQMSDATFFEYVTAEEQVDSIHEEEEAEPAEDVQDTVESLRARVRQLEAAQGAARVTVPPPPIRGARRQGPKATRL